MTSDVSEQTHQYFLQEAAELLQTMDDELQNLREEFSVQKVHNLMRAAHTLKGASASVGLEAVKKTTHSLEDVFKALCHPDTVVTVEMEGLIFRGYDCLKLLMSAQLAGAMVDEADILDRMATAVTKLQEMLGDRFGQGGHLPTSSELGFDMTKSIFEVGVAQRIEALAEAIEDGDPEEVIELLETQVEVFLGLAESLDLPGFGEIAQTTLVALEHSPSRVMDIASVALANYQEAQAQVLAGDRARGGTPSAALRQFCGDQAPPISDQKPPVAALPNSQISNRPISQKSVDQSGRQSFAQAYQTDSSAQPNWIKRLWRLLTHPIGTAASTSGKAENNNAKITSSRSTLEPQSDVAIEAPFSNNFVDDLSQGDRPTDLALTETEGDDLGDLAPLALKHLSIDPSIEGIEATHETDNAISGQLSEAQTAQLLTIALPSAPARLQSSATIRMSVDHLDQLSQAMGELLTYQNRQALYNEQLAALVQKLLSRIAQQQHQLNRRRGKSLPDRQSPVARLSPSADQLSNLAYAHFDALELDQYSDVQLLAQSFLEETVQQSESAEAIDLFVRRSGQELEKQKRLLSNTRETLLAARMLPLEKVFQRFPPAVERLQAQHHKQVEVVLKGESVLVDKVIADKLYDPMLHLVRNAFDHGIETSDKRVAQGKSVTGTITIAARQQGRHLVIDVRDDGKGLDLDMIRRKAVENQVVTEEAAAKLTPEQTVDLLFEAGFSTASEVDDLSGRGVGLDAVKAQVRSCKAGFLSAMSPEQAPVLRCKYPLALPLLSCCFVRLKVAFMP
ncbi:MAG: hybrid sensor histidine kinase/response regulator [Phormidesmis sp. RL_2_1]|nr:hybrid sensor histidine kinase/response regulator [Phormidesmis sp. RL_2_1]